MTDAAGVNDTTLLPQCLQKRGAPLEGIARPVLNGMSSRHFFRRCLAIADLSS